jgi:bla regulator protein BlaR1
MNLAELQAVISSIGWSLIHFLWQGTLITLMYWIITRSIESIHAKYWTGMSLVIVSLVVPLTNGFQMNAEPVTEGALLMGVTAIQSHQQINPESLFLYLIESSLPYFVLIWGLTVVFLSFRLIKSWIKLAAIRHECEPEVSGKLKQMVKNIAIKLDLPTIPLLKVSQAVLVPAAYGLFKPTVLLPLSLISQIPHNQLEAIIKHELCHLKRNDFVHNIIQLCADILLFFHPGIRWMNNDIRHIREQCCDQMVLSHETEAITYAKALTNIASYSSGLELRHSVHLGINDGMLLNRVKILLHNKSNQSSLMIFAPLLLMIAFVFMMLQPGQSDQDTYAEMERNLNQSMVAPEPSLAAGNGLQKHMGQHDFYPSLDVPLANETVPPVTINSPDESVTYLSEINTVTIEDLANSLAIDQVSERPDRNELAAPLIEPALSTSGPDLVSELPLATPDTTVTTTTESLASLVTSSQPPQELRSFEAQNSIMPQFKRYEAPEYPQHFWYNQIEQDVIATFKIKPNGKAYDINVSSQRNQFVAFEQEVIKAIKKWKFDQDSLNHSTLQRTYQQIFSFAISDEVQRNCELTTTGTRLKKAMPCNK